MKTKRKYTEIQTWNIWRCLVSILRTVSLHATITLYDFIVTAVGSNKISMSKLKAFFCKNLN